METNGQFFADKLMDMANLAAAALIFGQLVGGERLQWWPFLIGVTLLVVCGVVSYILRRGGNLKR